MAKMYTYKFLISDKIKTSGEGKTLATNAFEAVTEARKHLAKLFDRPLDSITIKNVQEVSYEPR